MHRKTILVTGASRGIGRSIAVKFASEGYHVFLNCHTSVAELTAVKDYIENNYHTPCSIAAGDAGNAADVARMFADIHQTCGHLDVLVNNAGISYIGLLMDMSDEDWRQVIDTNLSSVFYCCRAAIPPMISRKSGRIINISSMWGTSGASCEAAYSASKSGVNGLTRALAKELAPSNIQVNAIACGVIDTEMNRQLSAEERKELEDAIPAGRYGTPDEIARIVWDTANAPEYMTGQIIGVDGGYL
ncbi:3-oxoacyl-ACP reductase FabG [Sporofaciens sp. JLR.KK001]|uniref:elongation factor P 5-aminopentanone reductase n=1 Tax=Sporofaciens sp. JLR.KK001 TaxID=3112621 RepID=UPI002FF32BCA